MAKPLNYLLGFGERLATPIEAPGGGGPKSHPYDFITAKERLSVQLKDAMTTVDQLPDLACPDDRAVLSIAVHPAYLAKTYTPTDLFRQASMDPIGSREVLITPVKWGTKRHPKSAPTAEFFVSGKRKSLRDLSDRFDTLDEENWLGIRKIERISVPRRRVRDMVSDSPEPLLEVVLHSYADDFSVIEGFKSFMSKLGVNVNLDRRIQAGGLCFIPVRVPRENLETIDQFSFLRVAREMPALRVFRPYTLRAVRTPLAQKFELPKAGPLDPSIRVATFDGGMPQKPDLNPYVRYFELPDLTEGVPKFEEHGLGVTSAVLFGPLQPGQDFTVPFSYVDHFRVLDSESEADSQNELYSVLSRITSVLSSQNYEYINLSIGPDLPIEDNEVSAWTSLLDPIFSSGRTLATIAVGNGGNSDLLSGNARIQAPADCVNALAVGASDSRGATWKRADYSCVGPGRSPGIIKPDFLDFGGSEKEPFWVVEPGTVPALGARCGTSFSSPNALRKAIALRAHLGNDLSPLAVRALLIHRSEIDRHPELEVGRGRVLESLEDLISCDDDTVHVIYQDMLEPSKWLRAPVPSGESSGIFEISATMCYACEVDPEDTINYTRGGVEYVFRPHSEKILKDSESQRAKTKAIGPKSTLTTEQQRRADWHKWEPAFTYKTNVTGSNLKNPIFEIHCMVRLHGAPDRGRTDKIPYALVISVRNKRIKDLYNRVVRQFRQLQPLRPVIDIPVRT